MEMKVFIIRRLFVFLVIVSPSWISTNAWGEEVGRWKINSSGAISWIIDNRLPHSDHIEMSGDSISAILSYKVNLDKSFQIDRQLVWPMLRTIPNNTHASLIRVISEDMIAKVNINGRPIKGETVEAIILNGLMTIKSSAQGVGIERVIFPSTEHPVFNEAYKITNQQDQPISIEVPDYQVVYTTDPGKGVAGSYNIHLTSIGNGFYRLTKGEAVTFGLQFSACPRSGSNLATDLAMERSKR